MTNMDEELERLTALVEDTHEQNAKRFDIITRYQSLIEEKLDRIERALNGRD